MARCGRTLAISKTPGSAVAPGALVTVPKTVVTFTIRAVNASGVAIAWTLERDGVTGGPFHFAAGEAYTPSNLNLDDDLGLRVVSAAGSFVELLTWSL